MPNVRGSSYKYEICGLPYEVRGRYQLRTIMYEILIFSDIFGWQPWYILFPHVCSFVERVLISWPATFKRDCALLKQALFRFSIEWMTKLKVFFDIIFVTRISPSVTWTIFVLWFFRLASCRKNLLFFMHFFTLLHHSIGTQFCYLKWSMN